MELIADMLILFAATVGATIYCYVLAARLRRFTTLETGMGGAIAVLSAQVDDMTRALEKAQGVASDLGTQRLEVLTERADGPCPAARTACRLAARPARGAARPRARAEPEDEARRAAICPPPRWPRHDGGRGMKRKVGPGRWSRSP
jgi:hypothetical protein